MLVELSFLTAGVPVGYALRRISRVHRIIDQVLTWSVRLLLFLLGLSIGNNPEIMNNLDTLGLRAAFIALCAVLGSILLTRPLESRIQKAIARVTGGTSPEKTPPLTTPATPSSTSGTV